MGVRHRGFHQQVDEQTASAVPGSLVPGLREPLEVVRRIDVHPHDLPWIVVVPGIVPDVVETRSSLIVAGPRFPHDLVQIALEVRI